LTPDELTPTPDQSDQIELSESARADMEATASRGRLVRNVGILTVSQVLTSVASLTWNLIVPRLLGPPGMGLVVISLAASGLLLSTLGLGSKWLVVKEIAADPSKGSELIGVGVVVRLLTFPISVGIATFYGLAMHFHGDRLIVIVLAGVVAGCLLLGEIFQAGLQATERMSYLAYTDILNKAAVSVLGIMVALAGGGAIGIVILSAVIAFLTVVLNFLWLRSYFTIVFRMTWPKIRAYLAQSGVYWGAAIVFTFYLWIDTTMLSIMSPIQVVGWYGVPTKLWGALMFIPTILVTAWAPRMAAAFAQSPERLREVARTPVELMIMLSLPVGVGMAMVAQPLISTLYGPAFQPSVVIMEIIAFTTLPTYLNTIASQILTAANRLSLWTRVLGVAAVLNPLLNFFLIRYFQQTMGNGGVGAAISLLVTEIAIGLLGWILVYRDLDRVLNLRVFKVCLATAGMALAVHLIALRWGLVIQVAAGGLVFLGLCLLLKVANEQELLLLRSLSSKLPGRQR
jgi:O-antigen/teichoic acid export membrane protein